MFRLSFLFFLLVISVCSQEWKIQYLNTAKCALKGSSILLSGTYKHPGHLTVTEIFWTVNPVKHEEHINLFDHPDYKGRVQYFHEEDFSTFTLKLSNVTHEDEGMYCLRIVTNVENQRYLGYPGVELKVTELRVEVPEEVVEKHSAVLFCNSTCDLGGRKFTWYKNSKPLSETNVNELLLPSVSSEDAGKYSCAVRDQKRLSSPAVDLNIRYPPSSSWVRLSVGVSVSAVVIFVMMAVFVWLKKRHNKKVESENTYMTLDPTSRCSEYDTLDNMKRSCENTDVPEDQESSYYNINS